MTSRPLVIFGIIIIILAVVAAAGRILNESSNNVSSSSRVSVTNSSTSNSSTTSLSDNSTDSGNTTYNNPSSDAEADSAIAVSASSTADVYGDPGLIQPPASTTIDMSSWQIYVDNQNNYSIQYPPDLITDPARNGEVFAFPKNSYFHWPLFDTAQVIVTATPSCPPFVSGGIGSEGSVPVIVNGTPFTQSISTTAASGERSLEIAYTTQANGKCYDIDFLDSGTAGASLSVDDTTLAAGYDAEHETDMLSAIAILNGMATTFRVLAPSSH